MGKFCQCLTELPARDTKMAGNYSLTFLFKLCMHFLHGLKMCMWFDSHIHVIIRFFFFYAPAIFSRGAYSITAVRTYIRPVRNTDDFRAISFEKIGVLD